MWQAGPGERKTTKKYPPVWNAARRNPVLVDPLISSLWSAGTQLTRKIDYRVVLSCQCLTVNVIKGFILCYWAGLRIFYDSIEARLTPAFQFNRVFSPS